MSESDNPEFDKLLVRYLESVDSGDPLDRHQFVADHPEHAEALNRYFENVAVVEQLAQTQDPVADATYIKPSAETAPDQMSQTIVRGGLDSETAFRRKDADPSTTSSGSLSIPEQFGRYKIEKCLGQGAMGAVYLAHDTQLDRRVALKIPTFTDDATGELLQRFYREARSAATLRSPNICPVFDVGDIDGQHYITMAYIEGRPLKDFTKSKKAHAEKQIISTIRKLALGLAEAHEIGVVHRDLKPANIMVDKKGEPVVMDFGLARRSSSDDVQVTQSGAILGTPAYMAPEQVAGDQSAIDHRVDIYALGVIMYELITGEMPFKGNLMALLQQIALNNPTKPSELRPDIDPRLETICLKMMAADQTKRYQSMTDVAADLQEILRNPGEQQTKQQAKKTGPKPTSIPTVNEESNPALISIEQPKSFAEQLREKKGKPAKKSTQSTKTITPSSKSKSSGPTKNLLIAGGVGGLLLLLGILFFVRVGKYDVLITLDDPSIKLSVDGETLNIKNGQDVYKLSAGKHKLQLEKEGFKTHVEEFTVTKHKQNVLTAVVLKNGNLDALLNGEKKPQENQTVSQDIPARPTGNNPNGADSLSFVQHGLMFPEAESHVDIGPLPIDLTQPFCIEMWCKPKSVKSDKPFTQIAVNLEAFILGTHIISPAKNKKSHWMGSVSRTIDGAFKQSSRQTKPDSVSAEIQHVAAQWNGNTVLLFVNGIRSDVTSYSAKDGKVTPLSFFSEIFKSIKSPKLRLGSGLYATPAYQRAGNHFDGTLYQVRVSRGLIYDGPFQPDDLRNNETTVALYRFDEGTGNVLKDSSSNGHDGQIVGAQWVKRETDGLPPTPQPPGTPALKSGLEFDGLDDYVHIPTMKYDGKTPLTIEVRLHSEVPINSQILKIQDGVNPSLYIGWYLNNDPVITFYNHHTTGTDYALASDFWDGRPTYIAVVIDPENRVLRMFIDGREVSTYSSDAHIAPFRRSGMTIGAELVPQPIHHFKGVIEEVRLTKAVLYDKEFVPPEHFESMPDTLALYKFDQGSGEILKDSSGNGHDGQIIGAKWVNVDGIQTVNLLPRVEIDSPMGTETDWKRDSNGVVISTGDFSRTLIDATVPDEYELHVDCLPISGKDGLMLGLTQAGRRFWIPVNGWSDTFPRTVIEPLPTHGSGTAEHRGIVLHQERQSTVVVTVRKGSVTLTCDGKTLIDWKADLSQIPEWDLWEIPEKNKLGIGAWQSEMRISRLEIRDLLPSATQHR